MRLTSAKLVLVFLLVSSLGIKAWRSEASDQPTQQPSKPALASVLSESGFTLTSWEGFQGPAWFADRGDCRIEINPVSSLGWHQSAMTARVEAQKVVYLYRRQVYQLQPVMLTKLDYYWSKLANYFYPSQPPPVFAVVSSAGCANQSIDIAAMSQSVPIS